MLLVQLSDPHIVPKGELLLREIDTARFLREAIEHVNRLDPQPDLVLLTGDLVNEGHPEEYEHLRELLGALRAPFHLVPGNHDLTAVLRDTFPDHVHGEVGRSFVSTVDLRIGRLQDGGSHVVRDLGRQ